MPPESEAAFGSPCEADAIHRRNKNAIRDGVRALNRAPGVELRGAEFLLFGRMPANRGGIKKNVRAAQAREARPLRVPLVPAYLHADARESRIEIGKSQVARREIEFFIVNRIFRVIH